MNELQNLEKLTQMGNEQSQFEAGDLIYRPYDGTGGLATNASAGGRFVYHYGIYIGDEEVIDFTKNEHIRRCSLDEFAAGCEVKVERVNNPRSEEKIVETAIYYYKNPGEWEDYSLVFNNCEHFAKFCVTGEKKCSQIDTVVDGLKTGIAFLTAIVDNSGGR